MQFFAAASLMLISFALPAQVVIKGKVTDAGGNAIPGASVTIKNTTLGAAAGPSGTYELTANLKPGQYVAQFYFSGFQITGQEFYCCCISK